MNFVGKGQPLTRRGLAANLDLLGLGPGDAATLWAVIEVETAGVTQGFGFRVDRRPQMLFERHKFREFTGGRFNTTALDISGPAGGYGPFALQCAKLEKALAWGEQAGLGVEPALRSASWGMGQIMRFNYAGLSAGDELDGEVYLTLCQKAALDPCVRALSSLARPELSCRPCVTLPSNNPKASVRS